MNLKFVLVYNTRRIHFNCILFEEKMFTVKIITKFIYVLHDHNIWDNLKLGNI